MEFTSRASLSLPIDEFDTGPSVRVLAGASITEGTDWCPQVAAQVPVVLDDVAGIDARTSPRALLTAVRATMDEGTLWDGEWHLIVRRIERDFVTGEAVVHLESPDTLFMGTRHGVRTAPAAATLQTELEYVTNYMDPTGAMFPAVITDDIPAADTPVGDLVTVRPQWTPGMPAVEYLTTLAALYEARLYVTREGVLVAGPHRLVEHTIPAEEVLAASEVHDGGEYANVVVVRNSEGVTLNTKEVLTSSPRHYLNGAGRRVHVIESERAYVSQMDRALSRGWSQQLTALARYNIQAGDRVSASVPGFVLPSRRARSVRHDVDAGTSLFTFEPAEV